MSKRTKGWECPKCGKCFAPWVEECSQCTGVAVASQWPSYPYQPAPQTGTPWPHRDTYPWGSPRIWCGTGGTSSCDAISTADAIATMLEDNLSRRLHAAITDANA